MILLVDDARNPRQLPTKQNIIDAMRWLVRDACPNDSLFFHCAFRSSLIPTFPVSLLVHIAQILVTADKRRTEMGTRLTAGMKVTPPSFPPTFAEADAR